MWKCLVKAKRQFCSTESFPSWGTIYLESWYSILVSYVGAEISEHSTCCRGVRLLLFVPSHVVMHHVVGIVLEELSMCSSLIVSKHELMSSAMLTQHTIFSYFTVLSKREKYTAITSKTVFNINFWFSELYAAYLSAWSEIIGVNQMPVKLQKVHVFVMNNLFCVV